MTVRCSVKELTILITTRRMNEAMRSIRFSCILVLDNGRNTTITNAVQFMTSDFLPDAKQIMKAAGIQPEHRHLIPAKESARISLYPASFKDTDH